MKLGITYCGREREGLWSGTWDAFDTYFTKLSEIESIEWASTFPNIPKWYQKLLTAYCRFSILKMAILSSYRCTHFSNEKL